MNSTSSPSLAFGIDGPDVHQVVEAERSLRRALGELEGWSELHDLSDRLDMSAYRGVSTLTTRPTGTDQLQRFVEAAATSAALLADSQDALQRGDYEILRGTLADRRPPSSEWSMFLRQLRARRDPFVLVATNVLADMHAAYHALTALHEALEGRLFGVVADAGCGKTQLAAQLTAPIASRPAGILLHGTDLHAGRDLDDLAQSVVIHGKPVPSFAALVAAVDAAGQRAGRRLPIIIDGLNEAEDPRDWKGPLASLAVMLDACEYVLVCCTLRSAFVKESLPECAVPLECYGFEEDTIEAIRRYFAYYLIDHADADLPYDLLARNSHRAVRSEGSG